jgi:uncharacterized OsmC-like protein
MSKPVPGTVRNGVDVGQLMNAIEAVKSDPANGKLTFTVRSKWNGGLQSEHHPAGYCVGPQTGTHLASHSLRTDEPREILGSDTGMSPFEIILSALGSCLTVGYAANAAALGIDIDEISIEVTGQGSLEGFMNLRNQRPGISNISVKTEVKAPKATKEQLQQLHDYVNAHSPIWDTIANPVAVQSQIVQK